MSSCWYKTKGSTRRARANHLQISRELGLHRESIMVGEEPTQVAVGRRGPAWLRQDLRDPGRRRQPRCAVTRLEEASRGRHCSSWDQKLAPGRVPGRAAFTGTAPRPAPCCARPGVPLHVSTHPTLDTSRERGPPLGTAREGRGGGGNARCPLAGAGKGGMPTPTGALFWEPN